MDQLPNRLDRKYGYAEKSNHYPDENVTVAILFNYDPFHETDAEIREEFIVALKRAIFDE